MNRDCRILIVDDDLAFRTRLSKAFRDRDYTVIEAGTGAEVQAQLAEHMPTHAVLDLRLMSESGLDLLPELIAAQIRVVILTGYGSVATTLEAIRLGAANYIAKPTSFAAIESALFGPNLISTGKNEALPVPSLDDVAWEHIQRVLQDCDGNITKAAKKLGLHRQALQRKLRRR